MRKSQQRLIALIVGLPILVALLAALYYFGMEYLEDDPRTYLESIAWTSETLTSTGYGHDSKWEHPVMVTFVMATQFLGVSFIFLLFPFYLVPFFEETFEGRLPRRLPKKLSDYVLIYRAGPAVTGLVGHLERSNTRVVVFEEEEHAARRLVERGQRVIYGSLEDGDIEPLVPDARAIVCNGPDDDNGAVILAARLQGFAGDIYALAEDPFHRDPMIRAGATVVYTPRHILAAALAARASEAISPRVGGVSLLPDFEVIELRITKDSPLAGKTLAQSNLRELTGATVIGWWEEGHFNSNTVSDRALAPGTILVTVGPKSSEAALKELATRLPRTGPLFIAGYGEVGQKVAQLLSDVGEESMIVLDKEEGEGVDVVGDALDRQVLAKANAGESRAVIVSLDSDSATLFATSVIRDLIPTVPIIARVNRAENRKRILRAGADFALSLGEVADELLSQHLLGERAQSHEPHVRVVKRAAKAALRGKTLAQLGLSATGVTILAIGRGDDTMVELTGQTAIQVSDTLFCCGAPEAIRRFDKRFA